MNRVNTQGIVLSRTNYGEADRILTFLTPEYGKVSAIAKGVRKQKSKLAGGIELFSISDISYIIGRKEISTLISTRLVKHYGTIVKDLDRTAAAYEFLKLVNKNTEDQPEPAYFDLLAQSLAALDEPSLDLELISIWFPAQLLKLAGHTPNLRTDNTDKKLQADKKYDFDFEKMCFMAGRNFNADSIKFLRLLFSSSGPQNLQKVQGFSKLSAQIKPLVNSVASGLIRS